MIIRLDELQKLNTLLTGAANAPMMDAAHRLHEARLMVLAFIQHAERELGV